MSAFSRLRERAARFAFGSLIDATNPNEIAARPREMQSAGGVEQEVDLNDWRGLLSDSRKIYANVGAARAAVNDKAVYSVGRAWMPVFEGENKEWGKRARDWLIEQWYPIADVRGDGFDFTTDLFLSSISVDRDGDCGIALAEEDGFPKIQIIPAHLIGERGGNGEVESGPYRGLRSIKGVILNAYGRAVAYRILGDSEEHDTYISARDMTLLFDPEYADQVRGIPGFAHAILDLKDLRTIQGYEKAAAALCSAIGLVETNETGGPDLNDPANRFGKKAAKAGGPVEQTFMAGLIKYFRAGTNGKLETLKTDRPGEGWERLMDRLIRNAYTGIGWPYELSWNSKELNAGAIRLIVARAMRAVQDRQDLLRLPAKRCVGYAIAKAITRGILPPCDEWFKWGFTMPPRMSVDAGRDANAIRENYKCGVQNLSEIVEENGTTLEAHAERRKNDNDILRAAGLQVIGVDGGVIPTNDGRAQPLISSIGIGGVEALTQLIANVGQGLVSAESARAILVSVFGMSEDDAARVISDANSATKKPSN